MSLTQENLSTFKIKILFCSDEKVNCNFNRSRKIRCNKRHLKHLHTALSNLPLLKHIYSNLFNKITDMSNLTKMTVKSYFI